MLYKNKGQETRITTQPNLNVSQEGQITERFTRAIDQLGNPAIEIRLGGIYGHGSSRHVDGGDYLFLLQLCSLFYLLRCTYCRNCHWYYKKNYQQNSQYLFHSNRWLFQQLFHSFMAKIRNYIGIYFW